jgi:hypothetical protein
VQQETKFTFANSRLLHSDLCSPIILSNLDQEAACQQSETAAFVNQVSITKGKFSD